MSRTATDYLGSYDETNVIYAKTAHFMVDPANARSFTAEGGTAQGNDSPSGLNYNLVEDIALDFIAHQLQVLPPQPHHWKKDQYLPVLHGQSQVALPFGFVRQTMSNS
jgi:hypothetical protein